MTIRHHHSRKLGPLVAVAGAAMLIGSGLSAPPAQAGYEQDRMKYVRRLFAIAVIAVGFISPLSKVAWAQGLPPGQLPGLTAEWWQWALSIPAAVNPLTDGAGDFCMVGQRGPIWFLAGNLTGAPVITRTCSVPADKTLFFPAINDVNVSAPVGVCGSTGPETVPQLRADIKPFIDAAQTLVTVDGQPVKKTLVRRVQSDVFDIALPADNLFGDGASCPAQTILSPAVDDGFYVSLDPLGAGAHTIHIQASSGSLTIDVTYNLTVEPVTLK